jgi:hypothetical protein
VLTLYKDIDNILPSPLKVEMFNATKSGKMDADTIVYSNEEDYPSKDSNGKEWDTKTAYILPAGTYYMAMSYEDITCEGTYSFVYQLSDATPVFADYKGSMYAKSSKGYISNINDYIPLEAGEVFNLKVPGYTVKKWTSKNTKVATVTKTGKINARTKGTATITAELTNGTKITTKVSVGSNPYLTYNNKKVTSITVNKGKTKTIVIKGKLLNEKNKYQSTKIAKITDIKTKATMSRFKVKGLKKGTTNLKITVNGKKLNLKVKVK